jgi:hypothetical protein
MVLVMSTILAMCVLYLKLFLVSRKHAAAIAAMEATTKPSNHHAAEAPGQAAANSKSGHGGGKHKISDHAWRYTKTVLLIVGINCASWFPMGQFEVELEFLV